jgi:lipoxygenase/linoleate 9S-lipoxygenase
MGQVFKLMQPHFRYTMNINSNARNTLINAGGVVEKVLAHPA